MDYLYAKKKITIIDPASTKHFNNVLQEQIISGTISAMVGKDILTLTFPSSIAEQMNIERGSNLDYRIKNKKLIISMKENKDEE